MNIDRKDEDENISINDKLDLVRHITEIHSPVKSEINPDFIFAKLDTIQKEGIMDLTSLGSYGKQIFLTIGEKAIRWIYIKRLKTWVKMPLTSEEKKKIDRNSDNMFKNFMLRPYTLVNLNINKKSNRLIELVLEGQEEKEEEDEKKTTIKLGDRIKKVFANEKEEQ